MATIQLLYMPLGLMLFGSWSPRAPVTDTQFLVSDLIIISLAFVILFMLHVLASKNLIGDKFHSFFSFVCWVIITVGILAIIASPAVLYFIPLLLIIFVVNEILRHHIRSLQRALLWSIAIAVDKNIPLTPTIEAFSKSCKGAMSIRARKLAKLLDHGIPLPEALDYIPGILPARSLPMIQIGYKTGTLAASLRQAVLSRDVFSIIWNSLLTKLLYIVLLISFGISIFTFVMLKIVPSYEKIFKDFEMDLPDATINLISVSFYVVNYWFLLLPLYIFIFGMAFYGLLSYLGWVPFYFPGISRIMRRRYSANILDSLAIAAENNQPLGDSIATLAKCYPQNDIRYKLNCVGTDISNGADWCESLFQHGLIDRSNRAVLQAAQRVNNLPWAMREMADSNRRRLAYRLNNLIQLAYPPVIICLGLMVLFIVVSLFIPLVVLISRLTGL